MSAPIATNAASSGVNLDKKSIKQLTRRSNAPGLRWVAGWVTLLAVTCYLLYVALGTWWVAPAMLLYGTALTLPAYALSHECAHGTAFRTRWLNELFFWVGSLIYFEEPYHRRYAHARHHTYTWNKGLDAQMPFATPLTLKGWFLEVSGITLFIYELGVFLRNASGRFSDEVRAFTPASELPKLKWGARACLGVYLCLAALSVAFGWLWPVVFVLIPRIVGGPVMLLYTLIQHVEMEEDQRSILRSTRSFRTSGFSRFLYMNMNHHIEHHLYPMVPFHALPALSTAIGRQLPEPDPGLMRTNLEVLAVVTRRSLGLSPKSVRIRQAPIEA